MHNHICTHVNINWIPEGSIPAHGGKHLHRTTGCFISAGKHPIRKRPVPREASVNPGLEINSRAQQPKKKREKTLGDDSDVIV